MSPRFCGSCGAALAPGGAFCGTCGSAIAGQPQPTAVQSPDPRSSPPPPVIAVPSYQPDVPVPQGAAALPAAAGPAPADGNADVNSVEIQPPATVRIPCLSCRGVTPAEEDAASVSCHSCGTALPPPPQAAWLMLRDGAQYGPYTIAQLASYIADGRILSKDSVWYQGAAVRLNVNQLPQLGTVAPASGDRPAPALAVEQAAPERAPVGPATSGMPAAAAPEPASGNADWDSLEVQPGEVSLGSWVVGLETNWRDVAGSLTVTDRRLMFKPKLAGATMAGILLSQTKQFKNAHTVILSRDLIIAVHSKRRLLNTYIYVTTADGGAVAFNRGLMSVDPILAALQPR